MQQRASTELVAAVIILSEGKGRLVAAEGEVLDVVVTVSRYDIVKSFLCEVFLRKRVLGGYAETGRCRLERG